jgi:polyferredoxin
MTIPNFLIITLSALSMHRIWNYETITEKLRKVLGKIPYVRKPLLCPACNAFWFGLAAVSLWTWAPPAVSLALAFFMPLRLLAWIYAKLAALATAAAKPPAGKASPAAPQTQAATAGNIGGPRQ